MNKASEVLEQLASVQAPSIVILAPNAPPVMRTSAGLDLMMQIVLDANDIMDTFKGLQGHVVNPDALGTAGSGAFSFGMRGVGRFRVVHVTQRGSKVLKISRVPLSIPEVEAVCPDAALVDRLMNFINSVHGGLLLVSGPRLLQNGALVYALLSRVNHSQRKIVYAVERALTFLMPHEESIVIQSELGMDVASFAEGVESALLLEPDILYVGGARSNDDLSGLADAMREGTVTILSGVLLNNMAVVERLIPHFRQGEGASCRMPVLRVDVRLDRGGLPHVEVL